MRLIVAVLGLIGALYLVGRFGPDFLPPAPDRAASLPAATITPEEDAAAAPSPAREDEQPQEPVETVSEAPASDNAPSIKAPATETEVVTTEQPVPEQPAPEQPAPSSGIAVTTEVETITLPPLEPALVVDADPDPADPEPAPEPQPEPEPEPEPVLAEPEPDPLPVKRVSGSRVNLRSGPSTSNAVLGQLVRGDRAMVLIDNQDGWSKILLEDGVTEGWMSADFLTTE